MQTTPAIDSVPDVRTQLHERLLSLPFSSFIRCMADLLKKIGYDEVALSSRKDWRGRNGKDGAGGFDLSARLTGGGVSRRIVVQTKQFDNAQRVYLSHVDALRGVCLRAGATEGLLLSTGYVSSRIPRTLLASSAFAPVRVIDGAELLDLLITHRLGVWEEREGEFEPARHGLDDVYFEESKKERKGNSRDDCAVVPSPALVTPPRIVVTVSVQPMPTGRAKPVTS